MTARINEWIRSDERRVGKLCTDWWVFGGVDPSSGTAALLELARSLGGLWREGWRPKRSILFASWDAEELAMTSSTEWGEQHDGWLRERAVAYLNVDSAASGTRLVAGSTPSLCRATSPPKRFVMSHTSSNAMGHLS